MLDPLFASVDIVLQHGVVLQHGETILQNGPEINVGARDGLLGSAATAFFTTLVLGVVLIALVPEYTERRIRDVADDPLTNFVYGFVGLVLLILLVLVLVITIVGILVAIPLVVVAYLVWAIGATIAFVAIADRLVGHEDGWLKPVLLAAAINGGLTLTAVGAILSFAVGATGFGTILRDFFG